ncbi:MAG: hypothetical protein SGPRY_003380, partial [Prymnesium sp.]
VLPLEHHTSIGSTKALRTRPARMSAFCLANAAQALVNALFGSSTVVSAIGLTANSVHPLLFGTLRAAVTAAVLLSCHAASEAYTCWCKRPLPKSLEGEDQVTPGISSLFTTNRARFFFMILFLHTGNSFNLIGVQLAGAVTASLWQPSQPIFTMIAAAVLGTERVTLVRAMGIVLTVMGCMIMIAGSAAEIKADDNRSLRSALIGNFCLLINCLSTPLYIITSKPLVQRGVDPCTCRPPHPASTIPQSLNLTQTFPPDTSPSTNTNTNPSSSHSANPNPNPTPQH